MKVISDMKFTDTLDVFSSDAMGEMMVNTMELVRWSFLKYLRHKMIFVIV